MEDQEILDQFLEHRQQNYVIDNMSAVAGCGGIGDEVCSGGDILGVKYDEQLQNEVHDVGDDDEWKYVKEVQQSEKQQSAKEIGDYSSSNELAENEEATHKHESGANGAAVGDDIKGVANVMTDFDIATSNGHENNKADILLMDAFEGLPSAPLGSCAPQDGDIIESPREFPEVGDEEETSSLTTNTNGTSSLSENIAHPVANFLEDFADNGVIVQENEQSSIETHEHFDAMEDQMQSQLNPDAKEFVPTFGSNPTSPISPYPADFPASADGDNIMFFGQAPSAVPRHVFGNDDDFVAQSPRKGRGDNMDTISLPPEQEFDQEADKRPHELEKNSVEQIEMQTNSIQPTDTLTQATTDNACRENLFPNNGDFDEFQPTALIDHGPETCVDLDADIVKQPFRELTDIEEDVMKRSIYVANDEPIEDVLNSVQPIPTEIDSVNNSFTDEILLTEAFGDKELLQVEEKEHISNSPSTEEIQMHLNAALDSPDKEVASIPIDMDDAAAMNESFYMEKADPTDSTQLVQELANQSILADTTNPFMDNEHILEISHSENDISKPDAVRFATNEPMQGICEEVPIVSSTEEKHLMEETKEVRLCSDETSLNELMNNLALSSDGHLSQAEEVAVYSVAAAIDTNKSENFNSPDVLDDIIKTGNDFFMQHHEEPIQEIIESPKIQQDIESEMIAVEEPMLEAKQSALLFSEEDEEAVKTSCSLDVMSPADIADNFAVAIESFSVPVESDISNIADQSVLLENIDSNETEIAKNEEPIFPKSEDKEFEPVAETVKDNSYVEEQPMLIVEDVKPAESVPNVTDIVAATAAVAVATTAVAAAAITAKTPSATVAKKPTNDVKKTAAKATTAAPKPKVGAVSTPAAKKPAVTESAKKPIGVAAAKPRLTAMKTAPPKPTASAPTSASTLRKPIASSTLAPKVPAKTAATISSPRSSTTTTTKPTTARPTPAMRTVTSASTARKPAVPLATTAARPRPATATGAPSAAAAKPSTLGVGLAKPKVTSPRSTLASQLRKPAPAGSVTKSPIKSTTSNGLTKPTASSTLSSRAKPATSTTNGVGTTAKPFTARPAPKLTGTTTTTTTTTATRRITVGSGTTANTLTTTTKTTSGTLRKSSPIKPAAAGKTSTKPTNSIAGAKAKPAVTKSYEKKPIERKSIEKKSELNGNHDTVAPVAAVIEDQQQSPSQQDVAVVSHMPNINDSSIHGQNGGSNEHPPVVDLQIST